MKIEAEKPYEEYCIDWKPVEEGYKKVVENGSIEFRNVSARYRDDLPYSLKKVTFSINSG